MNFAKFPDSCVFNDIRPAAGRLPDSPPCSPTVANVFGPNKKKLEAKWPTDMSSLSYGGDVCDRGEGRGRACPFRIIPRLRA